MGSPWVRWKSEVQIIGPIKAVLVCGVQINGPIDHLQLSSWGELNGPFPKFKILRISWCRLTQVSAEAALPKVCFDQHIIAVWKILEMIVTFSTGLVHFKCWTEHIQTMLYCTLLKLMFCGKLNQNARYKICDNISCTVLTSSYSTYTL